jgi:periplasmic divalent cation tolerance protein
LRDAAILVVTNVPDRSVAEAIAKALLEQRLAACVNIGGSVDSLYHWQGRIETGEELPVLVKTRTALYPYVEGAIRNIPPYDTPEVLAIPIVAIDARYLAWLEAETQQPPGGGDASTDGARR